MTGVDRGGVGTIRRARQRLPSASPAAANAAARAAIRGREYRTRLSFGCRIDGRELALHQFLQNQLLPRAANLERSRQRGGEFHDAMIEKWRPHFERMRHAHAVHLRQNVVRADSTSDRTTNKATDRRREAVCATLPACRAALPEVGDLRSCCFRASEKVPFQ